MSVVTRGDNELKLLFDKFPRAAHDRLAERMNLLVEQLRERAQAAAPNRTGKLRREITGRVYADQADRIAGYVSIYAPGDNKEYPKAATLEYGTDKPRRALEQRFSARLGRISKRRIIARVSKAVHIRAFRYLRGSLDGLRPEIESAFAEALAAATENPT
jgi:hypothetical protein